MIDQGRDGCGPESVVDIHDRDARGAAVQHPQEGGNAAEAGAVADAGRHGDHRHADQAGDDARQRPFHSGDDDDDARRREARPLAEQAMQPGHADVVEPRHIVSHQLGRTGSFLGHRQIGRAGRRDHDIPFPRHYVLLTERDDRCIGIIRCAGHAGAHRFRRSLACTCYQQRGSALNNRGSDFGNLGRCFA